MIGKRTDSSAKSPCDRENCERIITIVCSTQISDGFPSRNSRNELTLKLFTRTNESCCKFLKLQANYRDKI